MIVWQIEVAKLKVSAEVAYDQICLDLHDLRPAPGFSNFLDLYVYQYLCLFEGHTDWQPPRNFPDKLGSLAHA
jgi:hypothetical protein